MNKSEKEAVVKEVKDKLKASTAAVLTDYRGLNVHDMSELRRELSGQGLEYRVYKNTLSIRAANEADLSDLSGFLVEPTAIAFGYDDPIAAAKVISAFARKHTALKIKGGLLEGRVIDASAIKALATLPSREVLLSKLLGTMQAPITGLATVLNGPIRGLAVALGRIADAKGK